VGPVLCLGIVLSIQGCASAPIAPVAAFPGLESSAITFEGSRFIPADSLNQILESTLAWDEIALICTIRQSAHSARVSADSPFVSVDGVSFALSHPVSMQEGRLLLPEELLAILKTKEWRFRGITPVIGAGLQRIVLDAGHGGKDPGALGRFGIREKDITLDMVRRVKSILERHGRVVALTRDTDKFISLEERTRFAHARKADLFVAIHANAARSSSLKGFEVYYISEKMDDETRASTRAENAQLELDGSTFEYHTKDLDSILWDLLYSEYRRQSIELAESVTREVERDDLSSRRASRIKGAMFYVLKGTSMPAVLIEIGYISNPTDAAKIKDSAYRQKMAEAIARGILAFTDAIEARGRISR